MSPFRILGVARNAGSAEIKRAYAAKLKLTRPDDDAEGFQKLHQAFKAALQQARTRESRQGVAAFQAVADRADEDADVSLVVPEVATAIARHDDSANHVDQWQPVAPVQPPDSGEPDPRTNSASGQHGDLEKVVEQPFDFPAFVDQLGEVAARDLPEFERWLNAHPALYSLCLKQELVIPLMQRLAAQEPPPRPKWFAAILHFFLLDTVAPKPFHVRHLIDTAQAHSQRYWQAEELAEDYRGYRRTPVSRLQFRELMGPDHAGRRIFLMFFPGLKIGMKRMSRQLAELPENYQRRVADPDAIAFWDKALDPARLGKWRVASVAVQIAVVVSLLIALTYPDVEPVALVIPGLVVFAGWLILKYNDVRKVRNSRNKSRPAWTAFGFRIYWRWVFWAIFILAQIFRAFSN